MIDLAKVFPIQQIEDGCLINGNGDITIGFKLTLPEVYTLSAEKQTALTESLISAFSRLPIGTLIHKQDFFYTDKHQSEYSEKNTFTRKYNLKKYDTRPVLRHYSNLYVTFSKNFSIRKNSRKSAFIQGMDYVFKQPLKGTERLIGETENYRNALYNGLNALEGFEATIMNDNELGCALYDYFNLSYDGPAEHFQDKTNQPMEIVNNYLKIGNQYMGILSLVGEGSELRSSGISKTSPAEVYKNGVDFNSRIALDTSYVFPIGLGLPIDHILNTAIEIGDNEKVLQGLKGINRGLNFAAALKFDPAISKQNNIKDFIRSVSDYNYQTTLTSVNVILNDPNPDLLNEKINLASTAFGNMNGADCWAENYDTANLFFCSCPGNFKSNYRTFINTLNQACCYLHKESHYRGDLTGNVFIDRYGSPVVLNMWDSPHIVNRNQVIIGPSGSGKSFFINGMIDEFLSQGNHVIVIDIGGSYRKNCIINNGQYYDSSDREKLSFNIFLCEKDLKGNYVPDDDKKTFIYSVILMIWKGKNEASPETKAILKDIVNSFYLYVNERKIFPDINQFYTFVPIYREEYFDKRRSKFFDFDSLELLLEPFANGEYEYLLNCRENQSLKDTPYVVFDVEDVKRDAFIFPVVAMIIIELTLEKIRKLPLNIRKSFIIDEGWDFLSGDLIDFVEYMYRTARKKEAAVALATQNVNDIKESGIAGAITINTDTKILLDHTKAKASYNDLQAVLSLTDNDIKLLDSIHSAPEYREFFIKMGDYARIFKYEVAEETQAVYTSKASEVKAINEEYERTGNMQTAIKQFVENKSEQT